MFIAIFYLPIFHFLVFPFNMELYSKQMTKTAGVLGTENVPEYLLYGFKRLYEFVHNCSICWVELNFFSSLFFFWFGFAITNAVLKFLSIHVTVKYYSVQFLLYVSS